MSHKMVKANWLFTPNNTRAFRPVGGEIDIKVVDPSIELPTFDGGLVYTGSVLTPTFTGYDPATMTMSGDTSGTEVGTYTAIFTPNDGFKWMDDTTDPKSVSWNIERITINDIPVQSGRLEYNGNEVVPNWDNYDPNQLTIKIESETDIGTYTAEFTPTANYQWTDGTQNTVTVQWEISKITPVLNINVPTDHEYGTPLSSITPSVSGNTTGTFVWTTTDDDFKNMMSPATVEYQFTPDDTDMYEVLTGTINVYIDEIDIPTVPSTTSLTYNGTVQTPIWNDYDPLQLDISGDVSGTNAGTYTAIFTPTGRYEWADGTRTPKSVQWEIGIATLELPTLPEELIIQYTGSQVELCPVPTGVVVNGDVVGTNVGTYNCTFCLPDKINNVWEDGSTDDISVTWEISDEVGLEPDASASINVDVSYGDKLSDININGDATYNNNPVTGTFNWKTTDDEFAKSIEDAINANPNIVILSIPIPKPLTFNGNVQTPEWYNYNSNKMTISGDTSATNAGTYTAIFSLTEGYQWNDGTTDPKQIQWTIDKLTLTIPVETNPQLEYNTSVQSPTWSAYDSNLITISGDTSGTNAGDYNAVFTLSQPNNCQWDDSTLDPKTVKWTINKVTLSVPSEINNPLIYNTSVQSPTWSVYNSNLITISGDTSGTNAGTYSVTFTIVDTINYEWTDGSIAPTVVQWDINRCQLAVPYITNEPLQYTGSTVKTTWSSFDTNLIKRTGKTSSIDDINNTVKFTLLDTANYEWPDGTTDPKTVTWVLNGVPYVKFTVTASNRDKIGFKDSTKILSIPGTFTENGTTYKVVAIDGDAFIFTNLTSLTIPNTVTKIGSGAFWFSKSLSTINIPDSVTTIERGAFTGSGITSLKLPSKLTRIEESLFDRCAKLKSVTIPEGVTYIGVRAFYECTSLTSITLPNTLETIDSMAFEYCTALKSITIPDSVKEMKHNGLFSDCTSLTTVNFNSTMTNLSCSFSRCTSLNNVVIPEGVTDCYLNFYGCTSLSNITFPSTLERMDSGEDSYKGTPWLEAQRAASTNGLVMVNGNILCDGVKATGDIVIPEGVKEVPSNCFYESAITNIDLPSTITRIKARAFALCTSLENVIIRSNIMDWFGQLLFLWVGSMNSVVIPKCVTELPSDAFAYCYPNTIYYTGTEEEWNAIDFSGVLAENSANGLKNIQSARKVFNYVIPA